MRRPIGVAVSAALLAGAIIGLIAVLPGQSPAPADRGDVLKKIDPAKNYFPVLRAELAPVQKLYFVGEPLLVDFQIVNTSDDPALLRVPYQASAAPAVEATEGLPLEYVFSRKPQGEGMTGRRALVLHAFGDMIYDLGNNVTSPTSAPADPIIIRPHGQVGCRVDLTKYYPSLTRPGRFYAEWRPCNEALKSSPVELRIMTEEKATIEVRIGENKDVDKMELLFFYDKAPNHVENFLDLARHQFYDGTLFHRVIKGFMVQGGDPLTTDPSNKDAWGTGRGPKTLKQEFNDTAFASGILGAARGPDVNSASCQFYIVTGEASHLTGQYTAFGKLADQASLKVAEKISKVAVGQRDRPNAPVKIERITVEPVRPATTQPSSRPGE